MYKLPKQFASLIVIAFAATSHAMHTDPWLLEALGVPESVLVSDEEFPDMAATNFVKRFLLKNGMPLDKRQDAIAWIAKRIEAIPDYSQRTNQEEKIGFFVSFLQWALITKKADIIAERVYINLDNFSRIVRELRECSNIEELVTEIKKPIEDKDEQTWCQQVYNAEFCLHPSEETAKVNARAALANRRVQGKNGFRRDLLKAKL